MSKKQLRWEVLSKKKPKNTKDLIDVLLENRGLKSKKEVEEFLNPRHPEDFSIKELGIDEKLLEKAIKRIKEAVLKNQQIIIYGDYDADGVCATAIIWECLYSLTKSVIPYLPDRFLEGYGINAKSVEKIKREKPDLKLIITVDNGIVAGDAVEKAEELGIDVIITDHHQVGEKYPGAFAVVHTDKISGSGVAWVLAREISKKMITNYLLTTGLELAAIGTIADQLPLIGPNRSIAKFGLEALNNTSRPGLLALYEEAGIFQVPNLPEVRNLDIGTYEVNYLIAPRINAMGRIKHAMDSLRLLCTNNADKAKEFAIELGSTNKNRQEIVDRVVLHARELASQKEWRGVIVLADESYHEGVIGLAAGKLVEEYYRPAIVLSRGKEVSKASARSISGFNIIENIRKMENYIVGGGGHPMAAGFSIETSKIEAFIQDFDILTEPLLTKDILQKRTRADLRISFDQINYDLLEGLKDFEPTGMGNFSSSFVADNVTVQDIRTVGSSGKHLKLKLAQGGLSFDAIAFNFGKLSFELNIGEPIDILFNLEENVWNGRRSLQLKVKDIHLGEPRTN